MRRKPRVLVLNERDLSHPKAGGAEIHVTEVFRRLAARGFEVTLASSSYAGGADRDELAGMAVVRLGKIPFYYLRAAGYCARETRRGSYDIVVECLNKVPFLAPAYSAVPVIALCHHLFGTAAFQQQIWPIAAAVWSIERLIPLLYRRAPFVSISESTREDLIGRGVAPDHVRVSHCGITRPRLDSPPISQRGQTIVYVGRLEPYKRIDVMLAAAGRLRQRFGDLELIVIGRGSDQPRLERIAAEHGVADRTRFVGFVEDAERDRLLGTARVCVCPSTKEGWGLTVIESNALGTPVVATDAPGLRDSVIDGKTGYLVAEGDVTAFAHRIGEILSDDRLADGLSEAALDWSREFDWDRAADEMADSLTRASARATG
ncbi:MAG: glycosyltransferase family 4 protein [Myxococcota bacterium]